MAPPGRDNLFGTMAVRLGHVTEAQVKECLGIQAKMRGMGIDEPLGAVMAKKGYITEGQARAILKALGVTTEQIPGYTLKEKIGQGGMGTVYRAIQTSISRPVAIKILSSLMTQDASYVARFFQEARAAGALNHRNIIGAIDVGEANGVCYFVMEHFEAPSLRDIVAKSGPIDEARALDIARQVADALDYIHRNRMIHRDIKPENLMVAADGTVKLCDFGLARMQQSEQSLTQTGFAVGTPYYMSPEQVTGEKDVDIRADLYALGATLWYAVTGRFVFEGKTAAETMAMHLSAPAPSPRPYAPRLSDHFVQVLGKLLEKDRGHRYPAPRDVIQDIDRMREGAAPPHASAHAAARALRVTRRKRVQQRRTLAPLAAVAVVVLAAVAVALAVSHNKRTEKEVPPAAVKTTQLPPPPPPPPPVDPEREDRAVELWGRASSELAARKWREAKASLEQLRREFVGTKLFAVRREEIGSKIGACEGHLAGQMGEIDRRHAEARGMMNAGSWQEAREALVRIRQEGLETPNVSVAVLERDVAECDAELATEGAVERIQGAFREARWDAVLADGAEFKRKHAGTESGRAAEGRVADWLARAQREVDAGRAVHDARLAALSKNWDEVMRLLEALERDFHATQTYAVNQDARDRLRQEHMAAQKQAMEREARATWPRAEGEFKDLLAASKFDAAIELLRTWEQKYKLTDEYANRIASVLQRHARAAARAQSEARERAAAELVKAAREAASKRLWEECWGLLERGAREYGDARAWKDAQSSLRAVREACEKEGGFAPHVLVKVEFEEDREVLHVRGNANVPARFDWGAEAAAGKRAGLVTFSEYTQGDWAWATVETPRGIAGAESFTMWLRHVKKGHNAPVKLIVAEASPGEEFTFETASVGSEWKRVSVRLSDFRKSWGEGDGKLEADRVRRFGFMQRAREAQEFMVDALRVEGKR